MSKLKYELRIVGNGLIQLSEIIAADFIPRLGETIERYDAQYLGKGNREIYCVNHVIHKVERRSASRHSKLQPSVPVVVASLKREVHEAGE
jgi:hypothetical protein